MTLSPSSDTPVTGSILEAENPLPALKGAPLSVLLALGRFGPMGRKGLIRHTGWKKDAITAALRDLVALGLVVRRHHRCWVLTLSLPALFGLPATGAAGNGDGKGGSTAGKSQQERQKRPVQERRKRSPQKRRDRPAPVEAGTAVAADNGAAAQKRQKRSQQADGRSRRSSSGDPTTVGQRRNRSSSPDKGREKRLFSGSFPGYGRLYRPWRTGQERPNRFMLETGRLDRLSTLPYASFMNDHDDDLKQQRQKIIHSLQTLSTPFDNAEQWLESVPPPLVEAWLGYFQGMEPQRRRQIRNPAGFIRAKVRAGERPPADPRASARQCTACERTHFDSSGHCLVCAGVVMV